MSCLLHKENNDFPLSESGFNGYYRITGIESLIIDNAPVTRLYLSNFWHSFMVILQDYMNKKFEYFDLVWVSGWYDDFNGNTRFNLSEVHSVDRFVDPSLSTIPNNVIEDEDDFFKLVSIVKGVDTPELLEFICGVFGNKEVINNFFRAPASIKYHHNCKGGLLKHSIQVSEAVKIKINFFEPNMPKPLKDLGIVGSLFHDIGKIRTFFDVNKRTINGSLVDHSGQTLEICSEALARLQIKKPSYADALRHIWTCNNVNSRYGYSAMFTIAKYIKDADAESAMSNNQIKAFGGRYPKFSTFKNLGSNSYWLPGHCGDAITYH